LADGLAGLKRGACPPPPKAASIKRFRGESKIKKKPGFQPFEHKPKGFAGNGGGNRGCKRSGIWWLVGVPRNGADKRFFFFFPGLGQGGWGKKNQGGQRSFLRRPRKGVGGGGGEPGIFSQRLGGFRGGGTGSFSRVGRHNRASLSRKPSRFFTLHLRSLGPAGAQKRVFGPGRFFRGGYGSGSGGPWPVHLGKNSGDPKAPPGGWISRTIRKSPVRGPGINWGF